MGQVVKIREVRRWPLVRTPFDRSIFEKVNTIALPILEGLCQQWLPGGRTEAREYVALNPLRADRTLGSFRINLTSGRWSDFATSDRGGDPVSYYAYINRLSQIDAARALARILGVDQ